MQVERVVSSLVLGTYVSVYDIVDQAFACADSGQMWDSPVVAELFATLTRHAQAQRWSGPSQASRSVSRHTSRNGSPAAASAVPVAEYAEVFRPPYYAIPSSSESGRATDEALEDAPAAQRARRA